MRLLRHPATSLWLVLVVAGLTLFALAASAGEDAEPQLTRPDRYGQIAAVSAFRVELAELVTLTRSPDERIAAWAEDAQRIVTDAEAALAGSTDAGGPLQRSWQGAEADLDALAAVEVTDEGALGGAVARLLTRGDELAYLVSPTGQHWGDDDVLVGGDQAPLTTLAPSTTQLGPAPVPEPPELR